MKSAAVKTIKQVVFDIISRTKGKVDFETITSQVMKISPKSKWDKTHWSWYRSQIKSGKYKDLFSRRVRYHLGLESKPNNGNEKVKRLGDQILTQTRKVMGRKCSRDSDLRFKVNRWVHSRLQQDERKESTRIKKTLWESGKRSCKECRKNFMNLRNVEIHRIDSARAYFFDNCMLLCRTCHQKCHSNTHRK